MNNITQGSVRGDRGNTFSSNWREKSVAEPQEVGLLCNKYVLLTRESPINMPKTRRDPGLSESLTSYTKKQKVVSANYK